MPRTFHRADDILNQINVARAITVVPLSVVLCCGSDVTHDVGRAKVAFFFRFGSTNQKRDNLGSKDVEGW